MQAEPSVKRRRIGRAWVLSVCPRLYQSVTEQWVAETAGIRVLVATRVVETITSRHRITGVCAVGSEGTIQLAPCAVIDATGSAEVVRSVSRTLLQEDGRRAAGGLIFTLRGVARDALTPPKGVGVVRALHRAAEEGRLPPRCGKAWLDLGVRDDEVYVKLFVPLSEDWQAQESGIIAAARQNQAAVVAFLRQLPGFTAAEVQHTGALGVRDGGRIRGEYCLTAADVRAGRTFPDAACRACWPIEYWHAEQGVSLEYLPDARYYEIPLRALRVRGYANLWAAGKCLSADALAHASARVAGTCWAMGEAAGKAAISEDTAWR
jgi:hypothetical protein